MYAAQPRPEIAPPSCTHHSRGVNPTLALAPAWSLQFSPGSRGLQEDRVPARRGDRDLHRLYCKSEPSITLHSLVYLLPSTSAFGGIAVLAPARPSPPRGNLTGAPASFPNHTEYPPSSEQAPYCPIWNGIAPHSREPPPSRGAAWGSHRNGSRGNGASPV